MKFLSTIALVLSLSFMGLSAAAPKRAAGKFNNASPYPPGTRRECTHPLKRKEWRTLGESEKHAYINAVKCLQKVPSILSSDTTAPVPGAVSMFDDFQGAHIVMTPKIHYVGQFLPWHRYFLSVYEDRLRKECGYYGAQPYWDQTLDVGDFAGSPLFSKTDGFGGDGVDIGSCTTCGDRCITDGPFKDTELHLGPGSNVARTNRCISRSFSPAFVDMWYTPAKMQDLFQKTDYETFWRTLEGLFTIETMGPHGAGHFSVGGTMTDVWASPGDPLFYFHHGNLDRLWWQWQKMDPLKRITEISGPVTQFDIKALFDDPAAVVQNVTLDHKLVVGGLAQTVTIRDVMHIGRGALCYEYV